MSALELRVAVPQDADVVALLLWQFNAEFQTWSPSVDELATRFTGLLALDEVVVVLAALRQWKTHVLARFDTQRISNGGTEASNLLIEKTRRLAHGFHTFDHYRHRRLAEGLGVRPLVAPT